MKTFPFVVTDEDVRQGNPNKPFSCALALALNRTAYEKMPKNNPHAQVLPGRAYIHLEEHRGPRFVMLRNTRAMDRFQLAFDRGNITHLDEPLRFCPKQEGT